MVKSKPLKNKPCPRCKDATSPELRAVGMGKSYGCYNIEPAEFCRMPLVLVKTLKFGQLMKCSRCDSYWFVNNGKYLNMDYVPQKKLDLLDEWNSKDLSPNDDQLKTLEKIGAVSLDFYGNPKEMITVPCRCKAKGRWIDFCLVMLQRKPPFGTFYYDNPNILLLDQITDIKESEFALPKELRLLSTQASDRAMGYRPITFFHPNGTEIEFNGTTHFFRMGDLKGKDIQIDFTPREWVTHELNDESEFEITYIIADWKDEYDKLIK